MSDVSSYLKTYNTKDFPQLAEINRREIMRYAGVIQKNKSDSPDITEITPTVEECIKEALPVLTYKVSYRKEKISWNNGKLLLPFDGGESKNLALNLNGCGEVVLFAATIGIGIDRLIAKYTRISPVKALFMQAFGAERIEALCDLFNDEIKSEAFKNGKMTRPRYSPGYGDLKLDVQKELMVILDCPRRLGINLNESLLMSPSKSVTAIIGICDGQMDNELEKTTASDTKQKCSHCAKIDCEYRSVK